MANLGFKSHLFSPVGSKDLNSFQISWVCHGLSLQNASPSCSYGYLAFLRATWSLLHRLHRAQGEKDWVYILILLWVIRQVAWSSSSHKCTRWNARHSRESVTIQLMSSHSLEAELDLSQGRREHGTRTTISISNTISKRVGIMLAWVKLK